MEGGMQNKPHIFFICQNHNFSYTSRNQPPKPKIPKRNYYEHAKSLLLEFSDAEMEYNQKKYEILNTNTNIEDQGIYLLITSATGHFLPLESLDTKDINLSKVYFNKETNTEEAIIFIPFESRDFFIRKFDEYISTIKKDSKKNPKNKNLINSIESIRLTNIKDFWTDKLCLFPKDKNNIIWWEIWIKKINNDPEYTFEEVRKFAKTIKAELGNSYLNFFNNMVFLIKTNTFELEKSIFLMTNLLELRYVPDTPSFFINLNSKDQKDWANDLRNRIVLNKQPTTAVCILDTGVNYNHPLLENFTSENYCISYNPSWPKYDLKPQNYGNQPYTPHGSMQAGIAAYGDLKKSLESQDNIYIPHILESGRILPPRGFNKPELYGAITTDTSYKMEIKNPHIKNRIFSLAVSANPDNTGSPSSWSAEIDRFTFGDISETYKRLFIISTGNNIKLSPNADIWDQAHLAKIEDPAQSWNSITVGSMTNLTTIIDSQMNGWKPWSEKGNISPSTRTSVNWEWKKQAPLKPDFVLEGGNRLLSSYEPSDITNHDDVSILTTSGDVNLPFDIHLDSSAACALASNYAALITNKYPDLWPETVRGLLIHSCKYNDPINNAYHRLRRVSNLNRTQALDTVLRTVGYGVPNIDNALNSFNNHPNIIIQDTLKPFKRGRHSNIQLNEWHFIELPWPIEELKKIADKEVCLKVTLSYFIEPNPQNKGYRSRFSYQSFGLRFKMIAPNQAIENFKASINKEDMYDEYQKAESDSKGWFLGPNLRTRGSIHSDIWKGTAADLMTINTIAIYPVSGWWKNAKAKERWKNKIRYSLILSIECKENIDIYTPILNKVKISGNTEIKSEVIINT